MNFKKIIFLVISMNFLFSCADYNVSKSVPKKEKKYYSSIGFALIFDENLYNNKIVNKKINNEEIVVMHNTLKTNTPITITNPENSKFIETKIKKRAKYPKIFNILISREAAKVLELDLDNPYVEIFEVKKNRKFIAKKSNTFEEERNVAEKVPVDEIKMDVISNNEDVVKKKKLKKSNFVLLISDFYYLDSAQNLKDELIKKTDLNNILIKKINNKKYRLFVGPFKSFNALKTAYISLNNLGFENLNVYKE